MLSDVSGFCGWGPSVGRLGTMAATDPEKIHRAWRELGGFWRLGLSAFRRVASRLGRNPPSVTIEAGTAAKQSGFEGLFSCEG
jgi:hypothetical protein